MPGSIQIQQDFTELSVENDSSNQLETSSRDLLSSVAYQGGAFSYNRHKFP